jgi:hypothetical protein
MCGGEAGGGTGLGKEQMKVAEATSLEQADLIDVFYAPFVRPLGNLVILYAQAEAALLALWVDLTGCTEKEAQKFLGDTTTLDAKRRQIVAQAKTAGIPGHDLKEFSVEIKNYYRDRERRHRLIHDEWYVSLLKRRAVPRTRGLPRKKAADVVWGDSKPTDVWKLARRFRDYRRLFTYLGHVLRDRAEHVGPGTIKPAS